MLQKVSHYDLINKTIFFMTKKMLVEIMEMAFAAPLYEMLHLLVVYTPAQFQPGNDLVRNAGAFGIAFCARTFVCIF